MKPIVTLIIVILLVIIAVMSRRTKFLQDVASRCSIRHISRVPVNVTPLIAILHEEDRSGEKTDFGGDSVPISAMRHMTPSSIPARVQASHDIGDSAILV